MKANLMYMLLLGAMITSSCQDSEATGDTSLLDSPFETFEYVTSAGRTYIPEINDTTRKISIYGIEDGADIVSVNYKLKEGVSILPTPDSRVADWRETELFILSVGDEKVPYETTLIDYLGAAAEWDAVIYPGEIYACEIKHHLFDLKNDTATNTLDTYSNAELLFQDYGMDGVRVPIWGATDTVSGEYGHPEEGEVNDAVYGRTYTRVSNALTAFQAGGGNISDFIVFISIKSSGNDEVKLPSWCFTGGVVARNNLIPEKYAALIGDLVQALKDNVNKNLEVQVIGLDNESSFANANAATAWMHYDTVPEVKKVYEAKGWSTPKFISYEAWEPKSFSGGHFYTILSTAPETVDIYGIHYYHDKDHPKYFGRLETDWNAAMGSTYPRPDGAEREFWASEPHWLSMGEDGDGYDDDHFKVAEEAMCTLWAQADLGMSAFAWWGMGNASSATLKGDLMRITSVPITGYSPIKFIDHDDDGFTRDDTSTLDDVARDYDIDSNNLKTRAFINGNKVSLYLINVDWYENRSKAPSYESYKIGLSDATFANYNKISYEQWVGAESGASDYTTTSGEFFATDDDYMTLDIPVRSITCLQFTINQ